MIKRISKPAIILPLYLPWLLSSILQFDPVLSYWIAWAGSFFIFYRTLVSDSRLISKDLPIHEQIMRPIFLIQIIFAGFMCCTSVFYFLNHIGYRYFERTSLFEFVPNMQTALIAECQRLSLLGHAALVSGMIYLIPPKTPEKKYKLSPAVKTDRLLIYLTIVVYLTGYIVRSIPAIYQFGISLLNTAIICGAFLMVKGFLQKKINLMLIGGGLFITNFIASSLTGFKEQIFVNFLIIGCLIYPYYRKLTLMIGLPVLYGLFYILPTYVGVIRGQAWSGQATAEEAQTEAVETIMDQANEETIDNTNWAFLTTRLSEIHMFTRYVETTPSQVDFYGFTIIIQSIESIIPRVLWANKPFTEGLSMERVYNAGVLNRASRASAKTRPVVDAYLSAGSIGVLVMLFLYGLTAQAICNKAESLFGGYQLGCIIIFNGMFQPMWRGNTFEFFFNSVFWAYVLMNILLFVLKEQKLLVPVLRSEKDLNQRLL